MAPEGGHVLTAPTFAAVRCPAALAFRAGLEAVLLHARGQRLLGHHVFQVGRGEPVAHLRAQIQLRMHLCIERS